MIAMAVKTNNINSAISPLFGKAKYFAIINENKDIEFISNNLDSGIKVVELLLSKGVKTLLISHMGEKPFSIAISRNVNIYFVGKDRITIDEALNKLKNGEFPLAKEIDSELFLNMENMITKNMKFIYKIVKN